MSKSNKEELDVKYKKTQTVLDENEILNFWKENKIFEKSIDQNKKGEKFVFYDGPPFATGVPHYGHIVPGTIKDVFPRYKSMKGFYVERQWGWDCHGMPIENIVEKKHNLNSKKEIEEFGIEKFTKSASESIFTYKDVWEEIIPKTGRWVDISKPYLTMNSDYIESVWWAFKELYNKGLILKDFKSMHICPRCETTLSNRDVSEGYKDIKDLSVIAKFELIEEENTFILAWTTTPWTLPGNVALAVGENINYIKVKDKEENQYYIFAKEKKEELEKKTGKQFLIEDEIKGSDLLAKRYKPLFNYYLNNNEIKNIENAYMVYSTDFVTTEDGTGIVHISPAFGEDDMQLGKENNMPFIQHVKMNGEFKEEVIDFAGLKVRKKEFHEESDIEIIKFLAKKGLLFYKEKYEHSYPHCWRCSTPLLNYAASSWFVDVVKVRNKLAEENKKVNWVPSYVGEKRFQNWLENARPWAISRSRYWGSPIPIWQNENNENDFKVIGSLEELKNYTRRSNNLFISRHGQSVANIQNIMSSEIGKNGDELSEKGIKETKETALEAIKSKFISKNSIVKNSDKIDLIITSPFIRTRQTAEIYAEVFGIKKEDIVVEERLRERNFGSESGKSNDIFHNWKKEELEKDQDKFKDGESFSDVRKRIMEALFEIDKKYNNKNILIVSHFEPVYLSIATLKGYDFEKTEKMLSDWGGEVKNSKIYNIDFAPYPHNENYVLDYHRPYIDNLSFDYKGNKYSVIKDVFDTWFDSGSMPYASRHYPFEKDDNFDPYKNIGYPADFISEGLDQTRGWFYVLMILGYVLFGKSPYKNVVVHGMLMAEDGKKMSKSLQNYPPIEKVLNIYGADALRLFLLSSSIVKGDSPGFSEKGVDEILKKVIIKSKNILSFYNLYKNEVSNKKINFKKSPSILDKWIIKKTDVLVQKVTEGLENYKLDEASREFALFIDDFSTWYIRRSRDRYKGEDQEDKDFAIITTKEILKIFSKTISPFTPFLSEFLWRDLKDPEDKISVCLEKWVAVKKTIKDKVFSEEDILGKMESVREIVSSGLEYRSENGIKVRQPLSKVFVISKNNSILEIASDKECLEIIKDELNIKDIVFEKKIEEFLENNNNYKDKINIEESEKTFCVLLDTEISEELKKEGDFREFLRLVQVLRKKEGLEVKDEIILNIEINTDNSFIEDNKEELKKIAGVLEIKYINTLKTEIVKLNDIELKVNIEKK